MNDLSFPPPRPPLQIPDTWPPEVACMIADFLCDLVSSIWATHYSDMMDYLERSATHTSHPPAPDDDFPF